MGGDAGVYDLGLVSAPAFEWYFFSRPFVTMRSLAL